MKTFINREFSPSKFHLIYFFLSLSFLSLHAQALNEILKKHFKALGQEKLDRQTAIVWSGKSNNTPFVLYQKRPLKGRLESQPNGQSALQIYDGKNGWILAPGLGIPDWQALSGPDLKTLRGYANIDGPLHTWKEDGNRLTLAGAELVDGVKSFRLRLSEPDGTIHDFFISAESYLIIRQTTVATIEGKVVETSIDFTDYKTINGMSFPFTFLMHLPQGTNKVIIEGLALDRKLSDALFLKPSE